MMKLVSLITRKHTAAQLKAIASELRRKLDAEKESLKDLKQRRGALFDRPASETEVLNLQARTIEDTIKALEEQIREAEKRHTDVRVEELIVDAPKQWKAI